MNPVTRDAGEQGEKTAQWGCGRPAAPAVGLVPTLSTHQAPLWSARALLCAKGPRPRREPRRHGNTSHTHCLGWSRACPHRGHRGCKWPRVTSLAPPAPGPRAQVARAPERPPGPRLSGTALTRGPPAPRLSAAWGQSWLQPGQALRRRGARTCFSPTQGGAY